MSATAEVFERRVHESAQRAWNEIQASMQRVELDRIRANPAANKMTRLMDDGQPASCRYYRAGKDGRGRTIRFCYSSHRNAAGYYLAWREVVDSKGGKRDQWSARKVRRKAAELSKRRAAAFEARRAIPEAEALP